MSLATSVLVAVLASPAAAAQLAPRAVLLDEDTTFVFRGAGVGRSLDRISRLRARGAFRYRVPLLPGAVAPPDLDAAWTAFSRDAR